MERARFGLPFKGYNAAVDRHLIDRDEISTDSHDLYFDPHEGKFYRRPGTAYFVDSSSRLETVTSTYRGMHAIELYSPNLSEPTIAMLFADPNTHSGTVWWRSWNGSDTDQQIAKSFGATHYPANLKFVPLPLGTSGWVRGVNSTQRAAIAAGSRRMLQVDDQLLLPCYRAAPFLWNRDFNDASGSGSRNERVMPAGMIPPLWPLELAALGPEDQNGPWAAGDTFYVSQMFQDGAGNYSMPFIPRPPGTPNLTGGFGLFTVPGTAGVRYAYIDWTIRIGPNGTRARWPLRSPKVAAGQLPDLADLRVCGSVPNNTVTTFRDFNGNDLGLVADPLIVRFDHAWMRPSRYVWGGNERVWSAYAAAQTGAMIIAPNQNITDDDAGLSTTFYSVRIALATSLILRKGNNTTTITISGSKTIQQVMDEINATTDSGTNGGQWRAQLVPGSDATTTSDMLLATVGTNFGDDASGLTGGSATGDARAYANSYPFVAHWTAAYLDASPDLKRRVFYTFGGPGVAPNCPKAWGATEKNFKTVPESLGFIMGGASVPGAEIVPCSRGIAVIKNTKDIRSGLDEDFYVDILNHTRGCIAFDSIVQGDGWVGYMTAEGFVVTDGTREVMISQKLWNSGARQGIFAYEIAQSQISIATNTFLSANVSEFHAAVMGNRIYLAYQAMEALARVADRYVVYDFSASAQASGLAEVLRPDGQPWGWSAPQMLPSGISLGCMAEIRTSTGVRRFAAQEGTSAGRVREMEVGFTDDSTGISEEGFCAMDLLGTTKRKAGHRITSIMNHSEASMVLSYSRDALRGTLVQLTVPAGVSTDTFQRRVKELPQASRVPGEVVEIGWGSASNQPELPEVFGFELEFEISEQLR